MPGLAHLPGPAARLRRLQVDLAAGRTCLWLLPDPLVECGDAAILMRALAGRLAEIHVDVRWAEPPRGAGAPVKRGKQDRMRVVSPRVADSGKNRTYAGLSVPGFGLSAPDLPNLPMVLQEPGEPLLARLADHETDDAILAGIATDDRVLAIRAWLEPTMMEVAEVAHRVPALARAIGPGVTAGRLLVAARHRDVPGSLIDTLHRDPASTVHWWWGSASRTDTASIAWEHIVASGGQQQGRLGATLRTETIAELAGPNLSLALDLADRWDGRQTALGGVLAALLPIGGDAGQDWSSAGPPAGHDRPPPALTAAWAAGQVDLWDDGLRKCWPSLDADEIRNRVWAAQLRVLLPAIELARQRLAGELVAAGADTTLLSMEIGPLRHAATTSRVRRPTRQQRERLDLLWSGRNALAHRRALDDDQVLRLCDVVQR